jgi:hypothetical protein
MTDIQSASLLSSHVMKNSCVRTDKTTGGYFGTQNCSQLPLVWTNQVLCQHLAISLRPYIHVEIFDSRESRLVVAPTPCPSTAQPWFATGVRGPKQKQADCLERQR